MGLVYCLKQTGGVISDSELIQQLRNYLLLFRMGGRRISNWEMAEHRVKREDGCLGLGQKN